MAYRLPRTIAGARRELLLRLVFNGMLQALATLAAARLVHDIFDTLLAPYPSAVDV
jgi:deoxyhypusine synthase